MKIKCLLIALLFVVSSMMNAKVRIQLRYLSGGLTRASVPNVVISYDNDIFYFNSDKRLSNVHVSINSAETKEVYYSGILDMSTENQLSLVLTKGQYKIILEFDGYVYVGYFKIIDSAQNGI